VIIGFKDFKLAIVKFCHIYITSAFDITRIIDTYISIIYIA